MARGGADFLYHACCDSSKRYCSRIEGVNLILISDLKDFFSFLEVLSEVIPFLLG